MRILFFFILSFTSLIGWGQVNITSLPGSYSNNFNSFNPNNAGSVPSTINSTGTGVGLLSSTTGWTASSTGTPTYNGQGTGTGSTGGYWGFGSSSEYSLGALHSGGSGNITYTIQFTNTTGCTISDLTISWNYEQFRYANTSGWDCSGTGSLIGNAVINSKDFIGSVTGTNGIVSSTPVSSFLLSGLSIANGSNFGIQWTTTDPTGSDNGVSIDDLSFTFNGICNTITTGVVSNASFIVDCATPASGSVNFTSTGTFNSGNTFTVQLSNASGSFASPTNIGTLSGALAEGFNPSNTINFVIPIGTATGTGYRVRVISSDPVTIGANNGTDISITNAPCPNSITTSNLTGSPFNLDCSTAATGTVDFSSVGTFNAGNTYTAQLSDALGDFTTPTVIGTLNSTANSGTLNISIPVGTASGSLYRIRIVSSDPAIVGTDNGTDITISNNCTITTGLVSSSTFSVSCSAGTNGTVDFTTSGTMLVGNVYSAQLSNASGNFTASTTIGTLSSTASSGTISFTIPATTPSGSGYLIRVISSNPLTTGTASAVLTITLTDGPCAQEPPHMTSVIINSCDPTCAEGFNEIVFGTSGDYSFTVNTSNFDFLYGSTNPGTNYTDVLVNNTTGINQLNTAAGCPGLFVDATGTTVPPNTSWMLVYTDICEEALTWSGLCGSGPIYVIFQNDANWNTAGNFANNPSSTSPLRYFRTGITTTSGSTFTINYTTDGNQYTDSDGVYATFDSDGGAAVTYGDNNCILSPVLLPSSLTYFGGEYVHSTSQLYWQTISEQNNSLFTLSHSTNGYNFEKIGTVSGSGNSTELKEYRFTHNFPHPGMNYYQLHSTDYDGTTYYKGIVAIEATFNFSYFNAQTSTIELAYESDIDLYSMDGKLIRSLNACKSIPFNQTGMFILLDRRSGITERLFVP